MTEIKELAIANGSPHEGYQLRLDDASIEVTSSRMPATVQPHVIWLASYVREKCNRKLEVLEDRVAKLGFKTTSSTFYKIFVGKYFIVETKGKNAGKFLGNVDNFVQIVDALRRDDRISTMAGRVPFIETDTWREISSYIDTKRAPDQVCKFGMIVGYTGSQKSACFKEYRLRNNHGVTVHLEAPYRGTMTQFITDLGECYGCSIWSSQQIKLTKIKESVNVRKCIIVDNVQRLYSSKTGGDQAVFNYLQKLQDDTGCTVILSFTPEFLRTLEESLSKGYFEQFIGRAGGKSEILVLPDHMPRSDVRQVAEAFGLANVGANIVELERISREPGRVRILFNALQKAKRLADSQGEALTIDHVREVRL